MLFQTNLSQLHKNDAEKFEDIVNIGQVVSSYQDDDVNNAKKLGLADLTFLDRVGFKGKDTPVWLKDQKIELPKNANTAIRLKDNTLVAKLSSNEYLFLNNFKNQSKTIQQLNQWKQTDDQLCYLLHRKHSHAWFSLTGQLVEEVLPKVCGVNLRSESFDNLQVAQTSLARINCIIIRDDFNKVPNFYILFDSASAEYLWMCLLDAMEEFSGKPIGYNYFL